MAVIKKIVRDNPLSNFQQSAPPVGGAFAVLADMAEAAYSRLAPAAEDAQKQLATQEWTDYARAQMGNPGAAFTMSSMGGPPDISGGQDIVAGLMARGMPQHIAEGFAMNAADESGFNPAAVGDNGNAYGLFQWNGPRKAALERYAAQNGASASDVGVQLDFLMSELQGSEAGAWSKIVGAADSRAAAAAVLNHFERPAEVHRARREAAYLGGNVTMSTSGQPVTMVREADGTLAPRLYSPLSGPILQAYNAAAGVAYISEMMVKGQADLMSLSEQFNLNPEGFAQAAQGYLNDIVDKAPDQFKADLQAELSDQVQRRVLGMVEERQRDTRQRAANSNQALIDLWTDNLASASVSGNLDEISRAESKLAMALRARETLPGLSWTPDQSANAIRLAREEGARRVQTARKQASDAIKSDLQLTIDAAKAGRASASEAVLSDPVARQEHPDLFNEALAFTTLRDNLPTFMALPPTEQKAALDDIAKQPVATPWELDLYDAAAKAQKENAKAWKDDPVKRAGEVLPVKPPPLPEFNASNPQAFIDGLSGRAAYGRDLVAKGYTDAPAFLTEAEALQVGALMGKDTPPEVKAALAGAIVAGFGEDAATVFAEIKTNDPVTKMSGMLLARGGDPTVAALAMRGQAMLDEKVVSAPKDAYGVMASPSFAPALSAIPMAAQTDLMAMATAIYAAEAPPNADEATQKAAMAGAVQKALGQSTNRRGQLTGGVQTVGNNPVLLPPGVVGEDVQAALDTMFAPRPAKTIMEGLMGGTDTVNADMWGDAGPPMMNGAPMASSIWTKGYVRLVPAGGTKYRMEVTAGNSVLIPRDKTGNAYTIDLTTVLEGQ